MVRVKVEVVSGLGLGFVTRHELRRSVRVRVRVRVRVSHAPRAPPQC